MPKVLADTVLYPVVRREFVEVGYDHHYSKPVLAVKFVPIGAAVDIADAKAQGFIAPVLDLNWYSRDGGDNWEENVS